MFSITRRQLMTYGAAVAGTALLTSRGWSEPQRGGTLVIAENPEPVLLTSALVSNRSTNNISPKIFDGLASYDLETLQPQPQLAESWETSADGKTITFHLRHGVKWHDGKPFTSADVEYTIKEILLKFHSRGQQIFGRVDEIETPDEHTVILKLSDPAPFLLFGLSSWITAIMPKHIYEGTDIRTNPANTAPIGTGPFKFSQWERGVYLRLARNEEYWDQPKPYVDQVIYRFLPDASSRVAALEAEDVLVVAESQVPGSDFERLKSIPYLQIDTSGYAMTAATQFFQFNLDKPLFQDIRVRRALAHAIDRDFIVRNIWYGYGHALNTPISPVLKTFHNPETKGYEFSIEKAEALLDEAGHPRGADGIRFSIIHDAAQNGEQYPRTAEYIRDALGKVGIRVEVRISDFASFTKRVYTDRDFETANYFTSCGPDPVIGVQRIYWSQAFVPGVSYSNGSHYASPEMDRVVEAAQIETDPAKRRELYNDFQRIAMEDIPEIPLVGIEQVTVLNKRLKNFVYLADGVKANFADAYIEPA